MESLAVHVYGVDELPLPNTEIVLLTIEAPYSFELLWGKVRYDYPDKYSNHLDALHNGVPYCEKFDLWYDENGDATHVACIVNDDFNLNVGDKWCYMHEYMAMGVCDNIFPFSDIEYRDVAIEQDWLTVINHHEIARDDHPHINHAIEHVYTFFYNDVIYKAVWVSRELSRMNCPHLHQYYISDEQESTNVAFDYERSNQILN